MRLHVERLTVSDWRVTTLAVLGGNAPHVQASDADVVQRILPGGWTLLDGGQVLVCGGVTDNWAYGAPNRVGTAWLTIAPSVRQDSRYRVGLLLRIRHGLRRIMAGGCLGDGYALIEANVDRMDLQAQRFAEWLGFRFSGLRLGFGPQGEDFILYALRNPCGEQLSTRQLRPSGP